MSQEDQARFLYDEAASALSERDDERASELLQRIRALYPSSGYARLAASQLAAMREPRPRRGLVVGIAIAGGVGGFHIGDSVTVTNASSGLATSIEPASQGATLRFDLRIGHMLSSTVALLFDVSSTLHFWTDPPEGSDPTVAQGHFGVSALAFLSERFWARGGAGLGLLMYSPSEGEAVRGLGPSVLVGCGYELVHVWTHRSNNGLSAELALTAIPFGSGSAWNGTLGLSYQWF